MQLTTRSVLQNGTNAHHHLASVAHFPPRRPQSLPSIVASRPRLVRLQFSVPTPDANNVLNRTILVSGDDNMLVVRHNPINHCILCCWRRYHGQLSIHSSIQLMTSVFSHPVSSLGLFPLKHLTARVGCPPSTPNNVTSVITRVGGFQVKNSG